MKSVPNCLSLSRIILSILLIFVKPFSMAFYMIYIICGLSDIFDGFIARKTGSASRLGEKLDSAADMVMIGILLAVFYPILNPKANIIIWIIGICIVRFVSMAVALKKYKTFAPLHTYGNKITGMILFLFPMFLPFVNATVLTYIICIAASISAIEELIIQITSNELQVNRISIFIK